MRAAIYARISEDRNGEALGVGRQVEDCRALADRLGYTVVETFIDNDLGASTRSRKARPQFDELMRRAEAGEFGAILFYSTSRLTRRPMEYERLIRLVEHQKVHLGSVMSGQVDLTTADGRAMARTLAAWDAAEAERTGERVARAALQRAELGKNHGGRRPFGYTKDGLHLDPVESAELRRAYASILAGVPLGAIARDLNARGVGTVNGRPWMPGTVRGMLLRPRSAGLSEHRGEIVGRAQWPPIVTEDVWRGAIALLTDPARRTSTGNRATYLLSGLARCGKCGEPMTSGGVKRSNTGTAGYRRIYKCRVGYCVGRRQDWIDEFVTGVVIERLSRPDAVDLLLDTDRPDTVALRAEAQAVRAQLDEVATMYAAGHVTAAQLRTASDALRGRLTDLETAQGHASRVPILADVVNAADVQGAWDRLPLARRRAVVDCLMTVVLHPGGGGCRTFDRDKVEIVWKSDSD